MFDLDAYLESGRLFVTKAPGVRDYTWRLLTIKEYSAFERLRRANVLSDMEIYYEVFKRCFVGNVDYLHEDTPFGLLMSMGKFIMAISGDEIQSGVKYDIAAMREQYQTGSVDQYMKRICIIAFAYRPEEVDDWNRIELIEKFVIAEAVLVNKNGYQPIDLNEIKSEAELIEDQKLEGKKKRKSNKINMEEQNARINQEIGMSIDDQDMIMDEQRAALDRARAAKLDKMKRR